MSTPLRRGQATGTSKTPPRMIERDDRTPPHVPPERVVDVDIYRMAGVDGDDLHLNWKRLQDETPYRLLWTNRNGGHWIVTRGADIARVYSEHASFSSSITIVPRTYGEAFPLRPTTLDPPEHKPYRKLLGAALSAKVVRGALPGIRAFTREAVERVRRRGRCDLISDVAAPIPVAVFMQLAQLPQACSAELPAYCEDPDAGGTPIMERYAAFLRPHIAARQRRPGGGDLLDVLACGQIDGRRISEDEAVDAATAVLTGGLDTVVSAAGFMLAFLARNPPHRQRLVDDSAAIGPAVTEMLRRFPLMTKARIVKREEEIDGVRVQAGDMIVMPPLHGLDDREFDDPLHVDFDRPSAPCSVFGNGVHHCPGHLLAQMELAVLLETWLFAIPEFALDPRRPPRVRSGILGAMLELGLEWDPRATRAPEAARPSE